MYLIGLLFIILTSLKYSITNSANWEELKLYQSIELSHKYLKHNVSSNATNHNYFTVFMCTILILINLNSLSYNFCGHTYSWCSNTVVYKLQTLWYNNDTLEFYLFIFEGHPGWGVWVLYLSLTCKIDKTVLPYILTSLYTLFWKTVGVRYYQTQMTFIH